MATIFSVKIHYGPCKSFYSYTHKPGKLTGLRDRLQTMGYRVQLVPEKFENYCMIEMCGHEVFRCNQTNLMFNTPFYRDPVCQRAVAAVHEASTKLCRARNRLWLIKLLSNRTFSNNPYRLVNHWPEKYELEPYAPVTECVAPCDGCLPKNK